MTHNPIMQDDGQFHELSDLLHELEPEPCRLVGHFCAEPTHWTDGIRHRVGGVVCSPGGPA